MMTDDMTTTPAASMSEDAQQQLVTELAPARTPKGGSLVGPDGLLAYGVIWWVLGALLSLAVST